MWRLRPLVAVLLVAVVLIACPLPSFQAAGAEPSAVYVTGGEGMPEDQREAIVLTARTDLSRLSRLYGTAYTRPLAIFLPESMEEFRMLGGGQMPEGAIGLADPSRRLVAISPSVWRDDRWRIGTALLSEISHLVLASKLENERDESLPRWLDEGLATEAALEWDLAREWPDRQTDRLRRYRFYSLALWQTASGSRQQEVLTRAALRAGSLPALARLDALFFGDGSQVRLAYAASYSFVHYLSRTYGWQSRVRFLDALEAGEGLDAALRLGFGKDLTALEKDWHASLLGEPWPLGALSTLAQLLLTVLLVSVVGLLLAVTVIRYRRRGPYAHARRWHRLSFLGAWLALTWLQLAFAAPYITKPTPAFAVPAIPALARTAPDAPAPAIPALARAAPDARAPDAGPPVTLESDTFIPSSTRAAVIGSVRRHAVSLSALYLHPYARPIVVMFASDPRSFPAGGPAGEVLAVAEAASGRIAVSPKSWRGDPGRLDGVLMHEVSHLVLGDKFLRANATLPKWLDEGLAQYVAETWDFDVDWAQQHQRTMRAATRGRMLLPLSSLEPAFRDGARARLAYAESYSFVSYLALTFGSDSMPRLVDRLASGDSADASSLRVFRRPFAQLEKEWRESLLDEAAWWKLLLDNETFLVLLWSVLAALVVLGFVLSRYRRRRAYEEMEEVGGERGSEWEVLLGGDEADDWVPD